MAPAGVGRLVVAELWGAEHLDSVTIAERALRDACQVGGTTLIDVFVHRFAPHGISGIAVIAESHLAVHTWPEHGYAAVDCFTCGQDADTNAMIDVLRDAFGASHVEVRELPRGIPEEGGVVGTGRFEEHEPGSATTAAYSIGRLLEQRRTHYQDLVLFESPRLGRVMALDGIIQMTDLDTYVYHEMLAHPALCAHPAPRRVAIVGGGDVHLVAEVLKHDTIESVVLLELDEEVVEIACKHWKTADRALHDPRVEFRPGDAFETIPELAGTLDAIMVDLTDPIGPAARLFEAPFYELCHEALRGDGMLIAQTESFHFHPAVVRSCFEAVASQFTHTELLWGAIATYPGAFWSFAFGSKSLDPKVARRTPELETRLYDVASHSWYFVPPSVREKLLSPPT